MPVRYSIYPKQRLVYSRLITPFGRADYLLHMNELQKDPLFHIDFDNLVDCRQLALAGIRIEELKELADRSAFSTNSRRAIVVSSELHFGLGNAFANYRAVLSNAEVRVYRRLPDALKWLNVPVDMPLGLAEARGLNAH